MATEQSERIKAALLRVKASRQSSATPTLASVEEPEPINTLNDFAESVEAEESIIDEEETALLEPAEEEEAEISAALHEDVETTLPLIAASEEDRVALLDDEAPVEQAAPKTDAVLSARIAPRVAVRLIPEKTIESRPSLDTWDLQPAKTNLSRNIAIVGAALAIAGICVFLLKDHIFPGSKPNATGATFPLQMQVESQGNGIINIRWNPRSAAVVEAREGRLVISERDQQTRTIALTPEQLQIGHLYYQSPAERVEFRLEITDRAGAIAKESVLALSSGTNAEPAAGPPVAPTREEAAAPAAKKEIAPPAEPPAQSQQQAKATGAAKAAPAPAPTPVRQPTRSFAPPPAQRRADEARAVVLDDLPNVSSGGLVIAPAVNLPDTAIRTPAPQVKQPTPVKSGGELLAPKLIKRVTPEYPASAKAANIQGRVRFTATIGKDGSIRDLQAVSGPPVLIPAATAAVKKWMYQPMTLDGQPLEVVTQIEVNFALRQ